MVNLEKILSAKSEEEINQSIIELDNQIGELCDYGENIDILSEPQRYFYFNQCLEREINNGGFNQYFINSSGKYAHETINSLKLIGANRTAEILQNAINQFPDKNVPTNNDEREELVEEIEDDVYDNWEELENEFFEYNDDLNFLNLQYVRENISYFRNGSR